MIHKKISISNQVNNLTPKAALLFTWMITHADDEGRLMGDARSIKALVVPMRDWSLIQIEKMLKEMTDEKLVYRWDVNGQLYIEFPTWGEYQHIRGDRRRDSTIPSYESSRSIKETDAGSPNDNQVSTQYSKVESSEGKFSKEESNLDKFSFNKGESSDPIAFKKTFKKIEIKDDVDPLYGFIPNDGLTAAVHYAWKTLEIANPKAFFSTYVQWANLGLPEGKFYEFVSLIQQDGSITSPGAVFNAKAKEYVLNRKNDIGKIV